jgi:hypothetical protein
VQRWPAIHGDVLTATAKYSGLSLEGIFLAQIPHSLNPVIPENVASSSVLVVFVKGQRTQLLL